MSIEQTYAVNCSEYFVRNPELKKSLGFFYDFIKDIQYLCETIAEVMEWQT